MIFQHRVWSELRGRRRVRGAGNGKTGPSAKRANQENPVRITLKRDGERNTSSEAPDPTLPRKAAIAPYAPVPQTDTGRRGENPKADERSIVKELGKMAP